jgi:hypothetical protein
MRKIQDIKSVPIHFILCTERTGSSLMALMLNLNATIICPSEEPFALYFYPKYGAKKRWTPEVIDQFVEEFWLMADKNLALYFTHKTALRNALMFYQEHLDYLTVVKLCYLHFYESKSKENIEIIIDKQIKYFFYLPQLLTIFPNAKFIILTRDVRDNVVSKLSRNLNWQQHPYFLSSLWQLTYDNMRYLEKTNSPLLIVRYEDFVSQAEKTLQSICEFIGVAYDANMLQVEGVYERFLASKKDQLSADFQHRLTDFHSGLFKLPSTDKIGQFKQALTPAEVNAIECIAGKGLRKFNYPLMGHQANRGYSLKMRYYRFLAELYRPKLLAFYYYIPFSLKIVIKRLRKKNVEV